MTAAKFPDPIAWRATLPVRQPSPGWRAVIKAIYGSKLTPAELKLFREYTGGCTPAKGGYDDVIGKKGRRGGGSEEMSYLACFEATEVPHWTALAPGQVALLPLIAPRLEQTTQNLGYLRGIADIPAVRPKVEKVTADGVVFRTRVYVKAVTDDVNAVSSPTSIGALLDECFKYPREPSPNSDLRVINSLRPSLAPLRGAPTRRLIRIGSAFVADGLTYEEHRDAHGNPTADILAFTATTTQLNPNIDKTWLAREKRKNLRWYQQEYECLDGALVNEVFDIAAVDRAFEAEAPGGRETWRGMILDPSSGKKDAFTYSIVSRLTDPDGRDAFHFVVIGGWEGKFFDHDAGDRIVDQLEAVARAHGVTDVHGDQREGLMLSSAFTKRGFTYTVHDWTSKSKPQAIEIVRRWFADNRIVFCRHDKMRRELYGFEERVNPSGAFTFGARGSGHDDYVALVLTLAMVEAEDSFTGPVEDTSDLISSIAAGIDDPNAGRVTHARDLTGPSTFGLDPSWVGRH